MLASGSAGAFVVIVAEKDVHADDRITSDARSVWKRKHDRVLVQVLILSWGIVVVVVVVVVQKETDYKVRRDRNPKSLAPPPTAQTA